MQTSYSCANLEIMKELVTSPVKILKVTVVRL